MGSGVWARGAGTAGGGGKRVGIAEVLDGLSSRGVGGVSVAAWAPTRVHRGPPAPPRRRPPEVRRVS